MSSLCQKELNVLHIQTHIQPHTRTHTLTLTHILNLLCGSAWSADLSALTETFCDFGIGGGGKESKAAGDPLKSLVFGF